MKKKAAFVFWGRPAFFFCLFLVFCTIASLTGSRLAGISERFDEPGTLLAGQFFLLALFFLVASIEALLGQVAGRISRLSPEMEDYGMSPLSRLERLLAAHAGRAALSFGVAAVIATVCSVLPAVSCLTGNAGEPRRTAFELFMATTSPWFRLANVLGAMAVLLCIAASLSRAGRLRTFTYAAFDSNETPRSDR